MSARKINNGTTSNAVLTALLDAACARFDTNIESLRKEYGPRTPPAERVILARGYFVCLVRSFRVPLIEAAKHLNITSQSAYNAQVNYTMQHGTVKSDEALELLAND